jgi:hypothetical protein
LSIKPKSQIKPDALLAGLTMASGDHQYEDGDNYEKAIDSDMIKLRS